MTVKPIAKAVLYAIAEMRYGIHARSLGLFVGRHGLELRSVG